MAVRWHLNFDFEFILKENGIVPGSYYSAKEIVKAFSKKFNGYSPKLDCDDSTSVPKLTSIGLCFHNNFSVKDCHATMRPYEAIYGKCILDLDQIFFPNADDPGKHS